MDGCWVPSQILDINIHAMHNRNSSNAGNCRVKTIFIMASVALLAACSRSHAQPVDNGAAPERFAQSGTHYIVPKGETFTCTPTAVYDGDGPVWCKEGPKLRIAGIAAREMDGTCRSNQPCPDATAEAAKDALVDLLGGAKGKLPTGHAVVEGPPLTCQSEGQAVGARTGAWCKFPDGSDLSCRMVATKTVLEWGRYWKDHRC